MLKSNILRLSRQLVIFMLFVLLSVLSTWPLPQFFDSRLPLATEEVRTVPFFNLWTIGWNIQCINNGILPFTSPYWNASIFFPESDSLAMSEPQPATMALAIPCAFSGSLTVVYNFYFLLSLTLNGWVTYWVLRANGANELVAFGGGLAMTLLPIVHWQAGVLQLVPIWGLVWTLHAWAKVLGAQPQSRQQTRVDESREGSKYKQSLLHGTLLGLAVSCSFAMCVHHGLFLVSLCGIGLLPFVVHSFNPQSFLSLGVAGLICLGFVGPIAYKHHQVNQQHSFVREHEAVVQLSAMPQDYLSVYGRTYLTTELDSNRAWHLSPGWLTSLLAIGGVLLGYSAPDSRKWTIYLATIGLAAGLMSLGTNLQVGSLNFWKLLSDYVPGFGQVRSCYRFAYFVQAICVLLAATFVQQFWLATSENWFLRSRISKVLIATLGLLAVIDPWPPTMKLAVPPAASSDSSQWLSILKQEEPGAVLILPNPAGGDVRDYERVAEWMVLGLQHGKPLVNGYSGFFPPRHLELAEQCSHGLTREFQLALAGMGVRYVLVYPYYSRIEADEFEALNRLTDPSDRVQLYEIVK